MSSGKVNGVTAVIRAARPTFRHDHDKVAFAVHASFLASGYFLTATGPSAYADDALSSSSSTEEVGIEHWNEMEDEYAFVYMKSEGDSKKVLVKCLAMNDKLVVDAVKDGGREPVHIEINVEEFAGETGNSNYSAQYKNLEKLVKTLDEDIISKLDGPSVPSSSTNPTSSESSRGSSRQTEPWGPQIHPSGVVYPPVYPAGGSDVFPTPPGGAYPTRGGFSGDGGMLIGPNDPRWFGGDNIHPGFPGSQPGVPPGARFDPYGPPGVPGFEPNRFARNPRRPGNGTHPDLEHFRDGSDFI